ncbi:L,D-transpeptidase [[Brevibacterium] frigoritolerans]|nr:L,D-transpeptidase [Peribacillus frigoritolerans]
MKNLSNVGKVAVLTIGLAGVLIGGNSADAANNIASDDIIIIKKADNTLKFYQDGKPKKQYSVATGKNKIDTPEGTFKVVNKVKNRRYNKKGIPGGDPRNPLGARWMGIKVPGSSGSETGNVYAIHGNNNESSIGKYVSAGCIRMHNDEVIELYDEVLNETPVYITSSKESFTEITKEIGYIKDYKKPIEQKKKSEIASQKGMYEATGEITYWFNEKKFEAKTNKGYANFYIENSNYKKNLKKGKSYTYTYKKDSKGNNIITQIK